METLAQPSTLSNLQPENLTAVHASPVVEQAQQPAMLEQFNHQERLDMVAAKREQLVGSMQDKGLLSSEFVDSGKLDRFGIDQDQAADSLVHFLVGDQFGGAHHLPTLMDLYEPGMVVASRIKDPNKPDKKLGYFRGMQRVKPDGTYKALHMEIPLADGSVFDKSGGSTMFPNEWNTEQMLDAILTVSNLSGTNDEERGLVIHQGEVADVKMKVITSIATGKIITGFPK